jgi:hypothetical protein
MDRHVVFVHGLRRAGTKVWTSSGEPPEVWPLWLESDFAKIGIWSVEHDSAPTGWRGFSMALPDRARNVLTALLNEERLKQDEIAFVTHSFGGLIVQQLLRLAESRANSEPQVADFCKRVRRVAFLGTPHRGAGLASLAVKVNLIARLSHAARGLFRNDANLRDLNVWFRRYAHENHLATLTLMEMRATGILGHIVKPDSADPGLPSDAIPIDADHFGISAPASRDSEIYKNVRIWLRQALSGPTNRTLVAQTAEGVGRIEAVASNNAATLQRIEDRLARGAFLDAAKPHIPTALIDPEVEKRLLALRQKRFIGGSNHIEEASALARELLEGDLAGSSRTVKSRALSWCGRLLLSAKDRTEAKALIAAAASLEKTEESFIAETIADSYEGRESDGLGKLAQIDSDAARSVSFIIVSNHRSAAEALDWLTNSGLSVANVDPDGKFFIIRRQLDAERWSDALDSVKALKPADFQQTPVLNYIAGGAYLVQTVDEELRTFVLWNLPFDSAPIPLADDAQSVGYRRQARHCYAQMATAAAALGCTRAADDADDRALWLGLRDPAARDEARAVLETSMRGSSPVLRRLPFALQFGLKLDLAAVEQEIERQSVLSSGNSVDAAIARFAIAFTKGNPAALAAYIDKHRAELLKNLNPNFVKSVEIQVLAQSGQLDLAEQRIGELSDPELSKHKKARLQRFIAEAKGKNKTEAREAQFKASNELTDLADLVEHLHGEKDWARLATYGRTFFERTRDISACRILAEALFELGNHKAVVELLTTHSDFVELSPYLESVLAWSLYWTGNIKDCRTLLTKLGGKRDDANDRTLLVNVAITSGDWNSLLAFIEQEWDKRADRTAEDLLRAGQLAQHLGSARAKDLIFAAADKADNNSKILIGCYSTAVSAGWEGSEKVFAWLNAASKCSSEDGPIKRVSMRELFHLQPDWQRREQQVWEQLQAGNLPTFAAGHLLNRSLIDLFLLHALANPEQPDPRRRGIIYAYSGARRRFQSMARSAVFDPSALLTAGALAAIDDLFGKFDLIVVAHSTLGWLFEERQKIQFHQPSKIAEAREIRRLVDAGVLQRFEATASPNNELASEVGDELAAFIMESEADFGDDKRQRLVVRSSPVHRVGSLMEEEADLKPHASRMSGCLDIVDALKRQGQLTQPEEQRARAYLAMQEKPWGNGVVIEPGAILYLDALSVSYLQHLGLLAKIQAAGLTGIIPASEVTQSDQFIQYESLSARATVVIENIRRALADGISSGKVIVAPMVKIDQAQDRAIQSHPTFQVMSAAALADVVVIDDRRFNQHGVVTGEFGQKQVWTTFDVVALSNFTPEQQREYLTAFRRAGFCFVPLSLEELTTLIEQAPVSDGTLIETAELKAIRESILIARLSNALQLPKEDPWLVNFISCFFDAVKAQWRDDVSDEVAAARSNWLLNQVDIRQWAPHYRVKDHPEVITDRYRGQILSLAMLNTSASERAKLRYWTWLEETVLKRIEEEQPDFYRAAIEQIRASIREASQHLQTGGTNGGE